VICPTCGYEFDPAGGLACPRCGTSLSCSSVSCAECGACSGLLDRLRHTVTERLDREERADDGEARSDSADGS